MSMTMGERIEIVRKGAKKGQAEFATEFSISLSAFKRYEKGQIEPPPSLLIAICNAYGISAKWLLLCKGRQMASDEASRATQALHLTEIIAPDYSLPEKENLFSLIYEFSEENEINNTELIGNIFKASAKAKTKYEK